MPQPTNKQIQEYKEKGYIFVDNLFSDQELAEFKEVTGHIIKSNIQKAQKKNPELFTSEDLQDIYTKGLEKLFKYDPQILSIMYDTLWQTPEFLRIQSNKEAEEIINGLMDRKPSAPLFGYINRCRINLPKENDMTYGWHQEIFQTLPDAEFIQIWAPLIFDASKESGAMEICEGSHKKPIKKPKWDQNKNGHSKIFFDDQTASQFDQIVFDLKLGQAALFTGHTLHRSGKNTSNHTRYSLVGLYHNIDDPNFIPPKYSFEYRNSSPKEYFDSRPNPYKGP